MLPSQGEKSKDHQDPRGRRRSASATTLSTSGIVKNEDITLEGTVTTGTTALLTDTSRSFANQCSTSVIEGTTTVSSATRVTGPVNTLTFKVCTHEKVVVNSNGSLSIERIGSTTNGTVRSSGASVTVPVALFGGTTNVTCTTSETDVGTLTGWDGSVSEIDINAVLNCGFLLPSALWKGTYALTSPGTKTHEKDVIAVEG